MIVLDTDHLSAFEYPDSITAERLNVRLLSSTDRDIVTTVITAEEQMRGWLRMIHGLPDVQRQVIFYDRLARLFDFFRRWRLLPFDARAALEFQRLRGEGIRIGSMDLKIASIALTHDAMLLSRNTADFAQVPGLRVEDWLRG